MMENVECPSNVKPAPLPVALPKKEPVGRVGDRLSQERQGVSALHRRRADLDWQLPRATVGQKACRAVKD